MKTWTRIWPALPLLALAAGCGGASTDYNDTAAGNMDVNAIADEHLLAADGRARAEAISSGAMPAAATATYDCADGSSFEARFDNASGQATLTGLGDAGIVLTQQRAGSGIWYRNDAVELRGKGREATLSREGSPDLACTARE